MSCPVCHGPLDHDEFCHRCPATLSDDEDDGEDKFEDDEEGSAARARDSDVLQPVEAQKNADESSDDDGDGPIQIEEVTPLRYWWIRQKKQSSALH